MDMTDSLKAKSDQLNALDLTEPRTFTIEKVTVGSAEQPFDFHLTELPGRPFRPSKGMRRVIAKGWGPKNIGDTYPGKRLTLFCEPSVKWAGAPVGGIRVSHMSDIGNGFEIPLAESRRDRSMYRVEPLPNLAPQPTADDVAACTDVEQLKAMWRESTPEVRALIEARVTELT